MWAPDFLHSCGACTYSVCVGGYVCPPTGQWREKQARHDFSPSVTSDFAFVSSKMCTCTSAVMYLYEVRGTLHSQPRAYSYSTRKEGDASRIWSNFLHRYYVLGSNYIHMYLCTMYTVLCTRYIVLCTLNREPTPTPREKKGRRVA